MASWRCDRESTDFYIERTEAHAKDAQLLPALGCAGVAGSRSMLQAKRLGRGEKLPLGGRPRRDQGQHLHQRHSDDRGSKILAGFSATL